MSKNLDPHQYYIVKDSIIDVTGYVVPGNVRDALQRHPAHLANQDGYYKPAMLFYEVGDIFLTKDIVQSYPYKTPIKNGRSLEIDQDNAHKKFNVHPYDIYYYINPILHADQVKPYDEENKREIEWEEYERMKKEKAEGKLEEAEEVPPAAKTKGKKNVTFRRECNMSNECPDGYECIQNMCAEIKKVPNREAIKEAKKAAEEKAAAERAAEEKAAAERAAQEAAERAAAAAERAAQEAAERAAEQAAAAEQEAERVKAAAEQEAERVKAAAERAAAEEEAERVKAAAEKAAESQKTQKTRVSIFVSHNKKLNCLFKELLETNEETEAERAAAAAAEEAERVKAERLAKAEAAKKEAERVEAELEEALAELAEAKGGGFQDGGVFGNQESDLHPEVYKSMPSHQRAAYTYNEHLFDRKWYDQPEGKTEEAEIDPETVQEKEAETETHFINGAVIKIEITDIDCKITLLNSTAEQIKDEIKGDKVEHTKHNHKVWCSDKDNEVLYLQKNGDAHKIYTNKREIIEHNQFQTFEEDYIKLDLKITYNQIN